MSGFSPVWPSATTFVLNESLKELVLLRNVGVPTSAEIRQHWWLYTSAVCRLLNLGLQIGRFVRFLPEATVLAVCKQVPTKSKVVLFARSSHLEGRWQVRFFFFLNEKKKFFFFINNQIEIFLI